MATLAIVNPFHNHRLQNRKLARLTVPSCNPELIHAWERPASMAWGKTWALVNRRQGGY